MLQNYYILAGLVGIYSMVKTNDPVVILVVGILSMFCFTLGFSNRPKLNDGQKYALWILRWFKILFSGAALAVLAFFVGMFYEPSEFVIGCSFFLFYQLASFLMWKYCDNYLKRRRLIVF